MEYYSNVARWGDTLLVRGIRDGQEFRTKVAYEPTIYIESHDNKDYGYKNIEGRNLKPLDPMKMKEATAFAKDHEDSNLKVYGFPHYHSQYCLENYPQAEDDWDRGDIRVFNIDIEVYSDEGFPNARDANYPVTAICVHDSATDKFVTFGLGNWFATESELPDEIIDRVVYIPCETELQLFDRFMKFYRDCCPQVITGWNTNTFDIPYLYNRMANLGLNPKHLSPWDVTTIREVPTNHGSVQVVNILGIDNLDYLAMYRKNKVQESYRLDHIASIELKEKKLDYSEVSGLHQLYKTNFQKFIDYNIQDVNLVNRLDEKLGLINVQISIAYKAGVNFEEVNGTVRTWDSLINKELWAEKKIPHFNIESIDTRASLPGGHVKDPQVGKHGWCLSFDLNSLYPHLIMQYNISPETLHKTYKAFPMEDQHGRVRKMLNRDPITDAPLNHAIAASGYAFDKSQEGIVPRVMRQLYDTRKRVKKEMLRKQAAGEDYAKEHLTQYTIKILLNSGYGALTNKFYRWFDIRLGESITLSGQFVIQTAEQALNKWMNKVMQTEGEDYIIAIDTDSNYINVQPLVDKFFPDKSKEELIDILDKIANEQIQKALDKGWDDVADYQNVYAQKMVMEREAIASSAFWTAKKRYAMAVWDMEGVRMKEPYLKIQGLEAIRSSTPTSCRESLLEMIKLTLLTDEDTVQKFIADFKEHYKTLPMEDIAFPRTMNNLNKYTQPDGFMKGTPPHVKGAIQFNRMLGVKGVEKDYELMKDGEKGKFCWLLEPNNVGTPVLSFGYVIPDEFDVRKYVDYEKMFEKTIIDPMKGILDPIGWQPVKTLTLMDFFQ